jgi:hypothetical protein
LGGLVILFVVLLFVASTLKVMRIAWPLVERKRNFLGYPVFVMTRNFSMAMGYSVALVMILVRKIEGREIAWNNI